MANYTLIAGGAAAVPVGTILDFAGSAPPAGYLECDGRAVSRDEYPALFAAIGTAWGAGNGSTTFNLPNLNGRVTIGCGTGTAGGATQHDFASLGGDEQLQAHAHGFTQPTVSGGGHQHNGRRQNKSNVTGSAARFVGGNTAADGTTTFSAVVTPANDAPHTHTVSGGEVHSAGGRLTEHAAVRHGAQDRQGGVDGRVAEDTSGGGPHD